jgi:hypothetical protein
MPIFNDTTFEKIVLPNRLYKYRYWRNDLHKRILTHQEIFFASPLDMNEQHECNLERDFSALTKELVYKYCLIKANQEYNNRRDRREAARKLVKESLIFDEQHQKKAHDYFRQKLNEDFSIFSASEHKNNFNLWTGFGVDQEGFCIGFNTRKMFNNTEIFGSGGKVKYYPINDMPKIRPLCLNESEHIEDLLKVIYSLPNKYAKEDEYRLAKIYLNDKKISLNKASFGEVILGDKMPDEHKGQIIEIVRTNFPEAKLLQANCNYDTEGYTFAEIN